MPTILLQEIIDILNSWKEGLGTQLEQALESLSNLEDNTDELETYLSSIDNYLSSINEDTSFISSDTSSIDSRINTISGIISDINSKLATANNHLNNISSNTASVVTPISNIKSNTDTLVQNSNSINSNLTAVSNNIGTISANTGISATYTEATATNTGNILQKVTTMASDTTQLRADNQNILDVLDSINDAVQLIPHDVQARNVTYDPSTSGIIATNVQDAIDALSSDLSDKVDTTDFYATNLPISANDSTNTKDYIDSGLSGKQNALSNQAITITPNTLVLSGLTGACYQYGKVVCLFVQTASPTSEVAYESILLTGLPKPVYASGNNRVSLTDRATNKPYRFRITDSGQLQEWYNSSGKIPSGADLYGTIVYLAE